LYSPATLERVSVEAGAGVGIEDRVRLLEIRLVHDDEQRCGCAGDKRKQ
jgi:hypothetical protein